MTRLRNGSFTGENKEMIEKLGVNPDLIAKMFLLDANLFYSASSSTAIGLWYILIEPHTLLRFSDTRDLAKFKTPEEALEFMITYRGNNK